MGVPYTFADKGGEQVPASELDADFAYLVSQIGQVAGATPVFVGNSYNGHAAALGGNPAIDDAPGIQSALDYAASLPGGAAVILAPGTIYYPRSQLVLNPTRTSLLMNGSTINWSQATFYVDPATEPNVCPGPTGAWEAGTLTQRSMWQIVGTNMQLVPPGPNLIPHPLYDQTADYAQLSTGPLGNTVYRISSSPADGAYYDSKGILHLVEVLDAPSTASGGAEFGSACIENSAHTTLQAFPVTQYTRYAFGAKVALLTGVGTNIRVQLDFYDNANTHLGTGFSWIANATSDDGWIYSIVDSPSNATYATQTVFADKTSASTAAALVSWNQRFVRAINPNGFVYPGYIDAANNSGAYADFGVQIPAIQSLNATTGRPNTYIVSFNVTSLTREGDQLYLTVALRNGQGAPTSNGIGYGAAAFLAITQPGVVSWEAIAPPDIDLTLGCWFTVQSNNGVVIDMNSLTVKLLPDNHSLRIETPSGGAQFDQSPHYIDGGYLTGPNNGFARGLLFETPAPALSSRLTVRCVQAFGWECALVMKTRAYLAQFYSCVFGGTTYGVLTVPNVQDAGEEITFYGCTITGGQACISNGVFELRLYGCSIDYPSNGVYLINGGTIECFGCHFEGNRPETAVYPFTCTATGQFIMHGGRIEISGYNILLPPVMPALFHLQDKYSRATLRGVQVYNFKTVSGFLADGLGRLTSSGMQGGDDKEIVCFTKNDVRHNMFGAGGNVAGPDISLPMYLTGTNPDGSPATRVNMYDIAFSSGSWVAAIVTDPDDGLPCLQLTKSGTTTPSGGAQAYIYFPLRQASMVGLQFSYKCPVALGGSGSIPLYTSIYTTSLIATATPGVFNLADDWQDGYLGENNPLISQTTAETVYTPIVYNPSRTDTSIYADGYSREGDTHLALILNAGSQPAGFVVRLRGFFGSTL